MLVAEQLPALFAITWDWEQFCRTTHSSLQPPNHLSAMGDHPGRKIPAKARPSHTHNHRLSERNKGKVKRFYEFPKHRSVDLCLYMRVCGYIRNDLIARFSDEGGVLWEREWLPMTYVIWCGHLFFSIFLVLPRDDDAFMWLCYYYRSCGVQLWWVWRCNC